MSTAYKIQDQSAPHFLTFQIIDWVDILSRKVYRDIIIDSMIFCRQRKKLKVYAYVIMTNHMHVIWRAGDDNLSDVIRDFKKFTARKIIETIPDILESRADWMLKRFEFSARKNARNSVNQFWTHENHAVELFSPRFIQQKLNYIHLNPVRAGWVENAEDYLYSSARNYANLDALMEIEFV
ncbi:REP-associated tyrosine transposase [Dyadobacter arcticus]|uniref:REP element-mobilizing transposase RayT n=1 Tax=Dyadobacter arcticus TaxID=1078754 RepID=A0ABX0ULL2_9BACT|nr:transposase [Dyadobacter arcticus]NIJ53896.1 REP element-mobilizing transposase RayT [Dyadobacter arcticus]